MLDIRKCRQNCGAPPLLLRRGPGRGCFYSRSPHPPLTPPLKGGENTKPDYSKKSP